MIRLVSLSLFPYLPSPPALRWYLLPLFRVVSSLQQLAVPRQHVCCSSCGLCGRLVSHILHNSCRIFLYFISYFSYLVVSFVLLCSRARYASVYLEGFTLISRRRFRGVLCLTVCHRRVCISLGWKNSTDTGCIDVVG